MHTAQTPNPNKQRHRTIPHEGQVNCLEVLAVISSGVSVLLGCAGTAEGATGPAQPELAPSTSVGSWQQGGLETSGVRE